MKGLGFAAFLVFFCLVFSVSAQDLAFYTPANGTNYAQNSAVQCNATVNSTSALQNITWNWNGTNTTFYNASLVLHYDFDNIAALGDNSTMCSDASLASNNGTFLPAGAPPVWNTSGKHGGALTFNGSNYVNTSIPISALNTSTGFTFSFWYIRPNIETTNERVIGGAYAASAEVGTKYGGLVAMIAGGVSCESVTAVPYGVWHYAIFTWNGSGKWATGWIDGKQICSVATGAITDYATTPFVEIGGGEGSNG